MSNHSKDNRHCCATCEYYGRPDIYSVAYRFGCDPLYGFMQESGLDLDEVYITRCRSNRCHDYQCDETAFFNTHGHYSDAEPVSPDQHNGTRPGVDYGVSMGAR